MARTVGEWLRDNTPADATIALNAAGAIPFFAERRAADMLGLNDVHIAHRDVPGMGEAWAGHEKGDGAYVLSKQPDYILFGAFGATNETRYLSSREMVSLPEFQENYALQAYAISPDTRRPIHAFVMWVRKWSCRGADCWPHPSQLRMIGSSRAQP